MKTNVFFAVVTLSSLHAPLRVLCHHMKTISFLEWHAK
jgi:hypothetical protein